MTFGAVVQNTWTHVQPPGVAEAEWCVSIRRPHDLANLHVGDRKFVEVHRQFSRRPATVQVRVVSIADNRYSALATVCGRKRKTRCR